MIRSEAALFTGLVERMGEIEAVVPEPPGARLTIGVGDSSENVQIGDSIAINGCCLTVVQREGQSLAFEAGPETLARTNLCRLSVGDHVNIERSMKLGDQLGGHIVTGHVDGLGTLAQRDDDEEWSTFWFEASSPLMRQMASKGSIAVDGVSLTLVDVTNNRFSVALIPHTLKVTTLGSLQIGDTVNLETDLLAKYVERQLAFTRD